MTIVDTFLTKSNPNETYSRFQHTKEYLKFRRNESINTKNKLMELGQILGYNIKSSSFFAKIQKRIQNFESCTGQIPFEYLEAIGVKREALNLCQEIDMELFEIEKGFHRLAPAIFRTTDFPENTSEADAIQYLIQGDLWKLYASITYPELLIIIISAGEKEPSYHWLTSEYKECKRWLDFGSLGYGNGVDRIG